MQASQMNLEYHLFPQVRNSWKEMFSPPPTPKTTYCLLYLPAWIRGLELGGTFPGTTFLLPSKTNESAHFEPTGQGPPRTFPVDLQIHFCLGFFMTMVIYLTLTSTLVQLSHLVPKQVLTPSRDKPSQAERGSNLGSVCVPVHSTDIKTKWITLQQWKQDVGIIFRDWPKLRL